MNILLRQAPNILSAARLLLAPVAAWLILEGRYLEAFCVFIVAGLTDAADGFLAKKFALSSAFGAWLDPAADKILMLASFFTLTYAGKVPLWLTGMVIGRDVAIVIGVLLARALKLPLEVKPLMIGKISTVAQVLYIALVLLLLTLKEPPEAAELAGEIAVAALIVLSFLAYGRLWLAAAFHRAPPGDSTR